MEKKGSTRIHYCLKSAALRIIPYNVVADVSVLLPHA